MLTVSLGDTFQASFETRSESWAEPTHQLNSEPKMPLMDEVIEFQMLAV